MCMLTLYGELYSKKNSKRIFINKKTGKPLLIDFTGHACANCRKTEEKKRNQTSKQFLHEKAKFTLFCLPAK